MVFILSPAEARQAGSTRISQQFLLLTADSYGVLVEWGQVFRFSVSA